MDGCILYTLSIILSIIIIIIINTYKLIIIILYLSVFIATAASKAQTAKKAALKGTNALVKKQTRTTTTFRRPKTLRLARNEKYPRRSIPRQSILGGASSTGSLGLSEAAYSVLKYPLTTESAMKKIEKANTLVFIVDKLANKHRIRDAVKRMYDCDCVGVNTLIRPDGLKKAYVRLSADVEALDVANKIGFI